MATVELKDLDVAEIIANEHYDTMTNLGYRIKEGPLESVVMTPNENPHWKTEWDRWVDDYYHCKVLKFFGVNIDDFMHNHGRFEAGELLRKAKSFMDLENKKGANIQEELEKTLSDDK